MSMFFGFGAMMAGIAATSLLFPVALGFIWRLNPAAQAGLASLGGWAVALMFGVSIACASAAAGLWMRAEWGRRLAVAILVVNLLGDLGNALLRGDLRALIGLPIGGALIYYLLSAGVRGQFVTALTHRTHHTAP